MKDTNEKSKISSTGKLVIVGIVMFFAGAIGLYALICFYPDPFVRTITEQI